MNFRTMTLIAAVAFVAGGPAAQAFTVESQGGAASGPGFMDLDKPAAAPDRQTPASPFTNENGRTTIKQGNSTFYFGQERSFNERYNANNLFDPYAREGR
jgi:hypothetical protein